MCGGRKEEFRDSNSKRLVKCRLCLSNFRKFMENLESILSLRGGAGLVNDRL